MSKFNIYTIYDKVAKRGSDIFLAVNDTIAMRQLKGVIEKNRERNPYMEEGDLTLRNLGEYEMGTDEEIPNIQQEKIGYWVENIPAGKIPSDHTDIKEL